jgi:hypothetical protein
MLMMRTKLLSPVRSLLVRSPRQIAQQLCAAATPKPVNNAVSSNGGQAGSVGTASTLQLVMRAIFEAIMARSMMF